MNRVRRMDQLTRPLPPPAWPFSTCRYQCICAATNGLLKLAGIPAPRSVRAAALRDAVGRYRYERPIVMGSGTGSEPSVSIIHCANNLRISDTTDALAGSHATL